LKSLGVGASTSTRSSGRAPTHKYDTRTTDDRPGVWGEDGLSRALRDAADEGIRIVLDGVFSHSGAFSRYFNLDGGYPSAGLPEENSPYVFLVHVQEVAADYDTAGGA
jgi:4-alpha-glucanotransferase